MRRVLIPLLVLLSAAAFGFAYTSTQASDLSHMEYAASGLGQAFTIPPSPGLADPKVTYSILLNAARRTGVNVLRTSAGYGAGNRPMVTQYVLLTRHTNLFGSFRLASGHWLTRADSLRTGRFLSSMPGAGPGQVGVLADFGGSADVSIRGLRAAFASLPVAGIYYVESAGGSATARFLKLISTAFSAHGSPVSVQDLRTSPVLSSGFASGTSGVDQAVIVVIVALTTLLVIYRQLYEAKRAGVMKMHGLGTVRVWFQVSGRLIMIVMAGCAVVATLASLLIPGVTESFTVSVLISIGRTALLMLGASLLTCLYISRIRVSDSVKNRKDTGGVFVLNTLLRVACSILLVVTGAGLWVQYANAAAARARLGNWARTKDFGIFYPTSVGNDLLALQNGQAGPTTAEVYGLYPVLNREGALFVESTDYEPAALAGPQPPGSFRFIQVNPNYLRTYPVLDPAGRPVHVAESTTSWVVLVPQADRAQAAAIRRYYSTYRKSNFQAEKVLFGRSVPLSIVHQKLRMIWIANQSVFSFNPLVNPAHGNMIKNPIITVMTIANSLGTDRANMITGGADTALKVRLTGGAQATLKRLQPLLKRLKLSDNLPYLVTMNGWVFQKVLALQQGIRAVVIAGIALETAVLVLVIESLALLYERNSRRFVVRKLFGTGMWRRYREFLRMFAIVWALQCVGAMAANAAGLSPFSTATAKGAVGTVTLLLVAALIVAVELAISLAVLAFIDRRNLTKVLKGEF